MKDYKKLIVKAASSALKKTAKLELSTATPVGMHQPKAPKSLIK